MSVPSDSRSFEPRPTQSLEFAIDTPARLAVLGGGPVGLEAALYARFLGYDVVVFERGRVAERLQARRHLPTLQTFQSLRSPLGLRAIAAQQEGFSTPAADSSPSVGEWLDRYLLPLAATDLLTDSICESTEVLAVGRAGFLRGEMADNPDRGDYALRVLCRDVQGSERIEEFDGVIDATGMDLPRYCGESGIPALGELAARELAARELVARQSPTATFGLIPSDPAGDYLEPFRDQRIAIVGETLDAALSLRGACALANRYPQTRVSWITRRLVDADSLGPIPAPGANFGEAMIQFLRDTNNAARSAASEFQLVSGTAIHRIQSVPVDGGPAFWQLELIGQHAGKIECDVLLAHAGYRVDDRLASELHVRRCPATDRILGDALDLAANTAGTLLTSPNGVIDGVIAEPHYHVIGSKRAGGQFGLPFKDCLTQIRRLFALLGDRPSLDLYSD
jgi:threonine dehydrogenase-like Zn-dependent dehydrogenase